MERSGHTKANASEREEIGHGEYENREFFVEHKYGTEGGAGYDSSLSSDLDSSGRNRTIAHNAKNGDEIMSIRKVDGTGSGSGSGAAGCTHEGTGSYGSMDAATGNKKLAGNGSGKTPVVSELSKSMDREYFSDVNTALQAVEER